MINMKVIKAKNAIMTLVIIAFLIMLIIKIFLLGKDKIKDLSLIPVIEDTIISASGNSLKEFKSIDRDNTEQILSSELQMSKYIKSKETEQIADENTIQIQNQTQVAIISTEEAQTGLQTEVVSGGNINAKYTNEYNGVQIKNESKYELTQEMLTPDIELEDKKDIIIYHTHTCESYTPTEQYQYIASGNFRTIDLNYSVSRVGDELEKA